MHPNTTPEPRVNKLGHTVTKHVKSPVPRDSSVSKVPAPSISSAQHREERVDRIVEAVGGRLLFERFTGNPLSPEDLKVKLLGFSDNTLGSIDDAVVWSEQLESAIHTDIFIAIKRLSEQQIREFMVCRPQMNGHSMESSGDNFRAIQGLHNIGYFKDHADLSTLDDHDLNIAGAFLRITAALDEHNIDSVDYENDDHSINIHDKDLQDLIAAYPDNTDEIISFIADRKTGDAAIIRAYIENGTALREGTL